MRYIIICIIALTLLSLCSDKGKKAAQMHLWEARIALKQNDFSRAKAEIDSINVYNKAFDERRAGMALLDSVRKAENLHLIENIKPQLVDLEASIAELKKDFVFQRDAKYQEVGVYVPKSIATDGALTSTTLRSGVEEDGRLFIESIYMGAQKHNKVSIAAGTESAESLPVEGDGYIHRFKDLGKTYETIKLIGNYENKLSSFVASRLSENMRVTLSGGQNTAYALSKKNKEAIAQSYLLSSQMILIDSLKTEIEKAEHRNFYLDNGRKTEVPLTE